MVIFILTLYPFHETYNLMYHRCWLYLVNYVECNDIHWDKQTNIGIREILTYHLTGETNEDSTISDDEGDGRIPGTELVVGDGCSEVELTLSLDGATVLNTTGGSEIF